MAKRAIVPTIVPASEVGLEVNPSEILAIKESCKRVGLSLDKSLRVILDAQSASIMKFDRDGDCLGEQPDHDKRLKAAMAHLELEGYYKNKSVTTDNSKHTNITVTWGGVNNPAPSLRLYDRSSDQGQV